MIVNFEKMTEEYANLIVSKDFSGNTECFNLEHEPEDIDDLLDRDGYEFIASFIDDEIIGFIECYFEDDILEISLALLPEYMTQGIGTDFVSQGVEFLIEYYGYSEDVIRSFINKHDKKTIEIMERVGFKVVDVAEEWAELEIEV